MQLMNEVIKIYSYQFEQMLSEGEFQTLCRQLPNTSQFKISQYRRWQDKYAALFGRLLLKIALSAEGYPLWCLEDLKFDSYNRPFIDSEVDFNISHSGSYVLCAITKKGRIGIDIEYIRNINTHDFKHFLTNEEWLDVTRASDPIRRFYHHWTVKESTMKADGRGLNIPPQSIISYLNFAVIDNKKWGLKKIDFEVDHYSCHLAFERYEAFLLHSVTRNRIYHNLGNNMLYPISIIEIKNGV